MDKYFEEVNGHSFPVRVVPIPEEWGCGSSATVADYEMWAMMCHVINFGDEDEKREMSQLDNEIFYYCDSCFIASDPTDEEIVEYLRERV